LLIDGLAYGAFPPELAEQAEATVLLHHPLCDESGLDEASARRAFETERAALAHARHVIVTSPLTARDVASRFGVAPARITVAEPGLDRAEPAPLDGEPPRLLAVGSVTPRKGYGYLVDALAGLTGLPWTCAIYGATDRDEDEVARIEAMIESAGLNGRIALRGSVPLGDLGAVYHAADAFVAPSLHEGYGMAVTEAMAHGLPVIASRAGALPETAPVARLVAVADTAGLRTALGEVLGDAARRRRMGAQSLDFARSRPGWDGTARMVAEAVR
jgi:glycosyltransferase involved in cell wall biosynthesis